jgi:DNA-binding NarL/FixJ family response regulator
VDSVNFGQLATALSAESAKNDMSGNVPLPRKRSHDEPGPLEPITDYVLTPREREVLTLLAQGFSTKEVAGLLGITFKTASSHRSTIMLKLDAHEVTKLVRYAVREGLIEP